MNGETKTTVKWLAGVSLVVGAWLLVSPYIVGLSSGIALWNTMAAGGVAVVLGLWQLIEPNRAWPSWANMIVALWLVIFPYALNPPEVAAYNNAVWSGIVLGIVALVEGLTVASAPEGSLSHRPM